MKSMAKKSSPITIANDPRFQLARALISSGSSDDNGGAEAAIDIFAALLEECRTSLGETSLDAALCQYEYGNALFRAVVRKNPLDDGDDGQEGDLQHQDQKGGERVK